jgi:hypothetical protein
MNVSPNCESTVPTRAPGGYFGLVVAIGSKISLHGIRQFGDRCKICNVLPLSSSWTSRCFCTASQSKQGDTDGRRTLIAGVAEEEIGQRGEAAPMPLRHPADQVRDLAGDLGLGVGHCKILLAYPLAFAVRDRHTVHPTPLGRNEEQLHVEVAVPNGNGVRTILSDRSGLSR